MARLQSILSFSPSLPLSHSSSPSTNLFLKSNSVLRTFGNSSPGKALELYNRKRISRGNRRDASLSIKCSSTKMDNSDVTVKEKSVSVILLAGGKGKRMGMSIPKQYLHLLGQPIALYSFFTFSRMPEIKEIIVVCDPFFRDVFEDAQESVEDIDVKFALPGTERQDSVYNGLQEVDLNSELVCVHDSARPLVTTEDVEKVLKDGFAVGAAVLGVPAKATIKEADSESFVVKTLDRKTLWEMQTPQVLFTGKSYI